MRMAIRATLCRHAACSSACDRPRQAPVYRDLFRHCRPTAAYAHRRRALTGLRGQWAGSAHWKYGWRRRPLRYVRLKKFATRFSIRRGPRFRVPARLLARRDIDGYDAICDHLLVVDHATHDRSALNRPAVVGTYDCCANRLPRSMVDSTPLASLTLALSSSVTTVCNSSSLAVPACFRTTATNARSNFSGTVSMHTFCNTDAM